ncbi:hypothetical protein CNR22_16440 [Sphingobacteriaceae bacterium]|nr:hypothetical protein CNR22_16440 [Sphingobacteriaceae bacterium]
MLKKIFLFLLLILFCDLSYSQKLNRFNKHGQRTGKWITYNDSAKTSKSIEGRYRNGNPKGTFYFYTLDGTLERKEVSRFKILKTTFYYPDKKIQFKGQARIDNETDKVHYYFFGKWKYYDTTGQVLKYVYYEKGRQVKTEYTDKNNKTNDSLTGVLVLLDTVFQARNEGLLDSISRAGFNIQKRERLQFELYMTDTASYRILDFILSKYGYPSKDKVHEQSVVPFYILSFAPTGIREKYLPLLIKAADKGDIEWKSLAFYIDKIKVAKGEKQVYGTQYYRNLKGKSLEHSYYPVEDPEKLQERRASVGL